MRIPWWIVVLIFLAVSLDKSPGLSDAPYYKIDDGGGYKMTELAGSSVRSCEGVAQAIVSAAKECSHDINMV